jgi:hypothetical protein
MELVELVSLGLGQRGSANVAKIARTRSRPA